MATLVAQNTPPPSPTKPVKADVNENAKISHESSTTSRSNPQKSAASDKPSGNGGRNKKTKGSIPAPLLMSAGPANSGLGPLRVQEMSPEKTLIEFISTSAAFHGVTSQSVAELEADLLKVFEDNIMPANAAAWFMAKRRYYMGNSYKYQLLPFLMRNYPRKFSLKPNNVVVFQEEYKKGTAKQKLTGLVKQGLNAYFSHKIDEYGVYFFDPAYYEATEPFYANLKISAGRQLNDNYRKKLVAAYFRQNKSSGFQFKQHNPNLVTITKEKDVEIITDRTAVIISMVDNQFGVLQFTGKDGQPTKAFFCAKSLVKDGWRFSGDPCKLGVVQFDGYRLNSEQGHWYAVLVWTGRKPSPRFCATRDDLTSNTYYRGYNSHNFNNMFSPSGTGNGKGFSSAVAGPLPASKAAGDSSRPELSDRINNSMQVGEVLEIHEKGAVVSLGKEIAARAWIKGWACTNKKYPGATFLTTTQGVDLQLKDLVAFYIDPKQRVKNCDVVGFNVMVLKHSEDPHVMFTAQKGAKGKRSGKKEETSAEAKNGKDKGQARKRTNSRKSESSTATKEETKERKPKKNYRNFILEDEFDRESVASEIDPPFIPAHMIESDLDFDEYSDDEIPAEEISDIVEGEKSKDFDSPEKVAEFKQKIVVELAERKAAERAARIAAREAKKAEAAAAKAEAKADSETDGNASRKAKKSISEDEKKEEDKTESKVTDEKVKVTEEKVKVTEEKSKVTEEKKAEVKVKEGKVKPDMSEVTKAKSDEKAI